jgi:hypothetical protein
MYLEGRGVPQNLGEASKWLKLVAQPQFSLKQPQPPQPPQ